MKILRKLFKRKTRAEKISNYGNYLCACMICGEITGQEAIEDLEYYITTLQNEVR